MKRRFLLGFFVAALSSTGLLAADWPQWRGPNRDGKSAETNLLKSWPQEGPKLVWESDKAGTGYGSPAVIKDKIYLIGGSSPKSDSKDSLICMSAKTGDVLWSKQFGSKTAKYLDGWGGGPRATPTVDGDNIYVLGATGDIACMSAKNGDIIWAKNLVDDFKGAIPQWGYSESVLIDGDVAVCTPGKGSGMIALDKKTGKTIWVCDKLKDGAGYSSIMIADVKGKKAYIQQTMEHAVAVNAGNGELLWSSGEIKRSVAVIPTPVISGNKVFFTTGYGGGCELIELDTGTVVYKQKLVNHHGGVILHEKAVFGHSDQGGWTCLDFEKGDTLWQNKGVGKGSISFADGHFYCYSESNGTLALVAPNKNEYKEISSFKIPSQSKLRPNQGKVWPHPVIANGQLYLRDFEKLFVYDIKGSAE
jgi:outer membrane protein assembly factor BamB